MAAYDLHIHSGYSSDGELPVAAIVGLCAARGLDAFSLTDHNSVRGVGEAARLAREILAQNWEESGELEDYGARAELAALRALWKELEPEKP